MRMICPRCGVKGKENAEFCISCGQPLKAAVSSVPPTRISHAPAHKLNRGDAMADTLVSPSSRGEIKEVRVRYRAVSPGNENQSSTEWQTDGIQKTSSFKETILNHAPPSTAPDASIASKTPLASPKSPSTSAADGEPLSSQEKVATEVAAKQTSVEAIPEMPDEVAPVSIELIKRSIKRNPKITSGNIPSLEIQHIWYRITQTSGWNTLALIPASNEVNALSVAHGLGTMAVRESSDFVRVVNASIGDAETSGKKSTSTSEQPDQSSYPYDYFDLVRQLGNDMSSDAVTHLTRELLGQFDKAKSSGVLRDGKVIVVVDPIHTHPSAISISRAVDRVVVCVKIGETRFEAIKHILANVDRKKVLGCIAITPS